MEQRPRLAEHDTISAVERDELAAQHQLLIAANLVRRRLTRLLLRLIRNAERFREAECGLLVVSQGLVDLSKVEVVRNQMVCRELGVIYLLLYLSALYFLLSKRLFIDELHAEAGSTCILCHLAALGLLPLFRLYLLQRLLFC